MAPAAPGTALVGPGAGEVEEVLPWDGAEMASLLAGKNTGGPISRRLSQADAAFAWTRSAALVELLSSRVRRLLVHDPTPAPGSGHVSAWLSRPLAELGVSPVRNLPVLQFTGTETRAAASLLTALPPGFLAIHQGSGSAAKNWSKERFLTLAQRLAGERRWLLVLGPAERETGVAPPPAALVARELPLRVLGAILSRAGLFVGNDSGITHLAAAAGAPTLALFGPTDPSVWAPLGPNVRAVHRTGDAPAALSVEEVLEEARELLGTAALTSGASGPPSG